MIQQTFFSAFGANEYHAKLKIHLILKPIVNKFGIFLGTKRIDLRSNRRKKKGDIRMKVWLRWIPLVLAFVLVMSCAKKVTEEQLRAQAMDFETKEQWQDVVKMYEKLVKKFAKSPKADEYLYKLGIYYANNLKDFTKSVNSYQRLLKDYPQSNWVIQATFMIGYRYANDIKNLDEAKKAYETFLAKYPTHELAPSVRWELEHLGQDISDIELQLGDDGGSGATDPATK